MGDFDLQALLGMIYPNQCPSCGQLVQDQNAVCPECWGNTHFITGCCCDTCGIDLPGDVPGGDIQCDDCISDPKPWGRGRAALMYEGASRQMILGLKHGDRTDLANPMAGWMAQAITDILPDDPIFIPVPLHWRRMMRRKYNQAALLALQVGRKTKSTICLDGLQRIRHTDALDGQTKGERMAGVFSSMRAHPGRMDELEGRNIILVDDVMTTGATFKEATRAIKTANVASVSVLALARVGNAP